MQMLEMFYDEIQDAVDRNVPFIIPIGTMEYHARHASCGTDTLTVIGCLRELEKEKEIVVCPPIWYGVASFAVCAPKPSHFHVHEDAYTDYLYWILKSMIEAGHRNVYMVVDHQTEDNVLMPMTIACHKAAKKVTMEYLEKTLGKGWWGSSAYATYYDDMGGSDDPFSWLKVVPLMGGGAQERAGGVDHAGKMETSLLMATYPKMVDLSRCNQNTEWFAANASEASMEIGKRMVECALEWLREAIR